MSAPADPENRTPEIAAGSNGWWQEVNELDTATYAAIAATPTPTLDGVFWQLSRAADRWKLWLGVAALLSTLGGRRGRRSSVYGIGAMAVTSTVVHLLLKPFGDRRRPDRTLHQVPIARQVSMPASTSFPSGHAAAGAAFAAGVASVFPEVGAPISAGAALVAYSRVHTGVHYPLDVIAGSVAGTAIAQILTAAFDRRLHGRTQSVEVSGAVP